MTTTDHEAYIERAYRDLYDEIRPLRHLSIACQLQIKSGLLRLPGYESDRMFQGRLERLNEARRPLAESMGPEQGDAVPLADTIFLAARIYSNQQRCEHKNQEPTGESIPMGSFTARPRICKDCGLRFSDD